MSADRDWPAEIHAALKKLDVRLVPYVPDAGHKRLIELCREDNEMRAVVCSTEEEGVGLAAGGWLGGARSVLLMQSSGVGNCINTLSMIRVGNFPLLTVVTMRGQWGEFNPWQVPMGQTSAEILRLSGVHVYEVHSKDEVAETVAAAGRLAFDSSVAVAVLISQRVIGTKSFGR
jgi:sulfopyruvate decarboxylase alpha subunit